MKIERSKLSIAIESLDRNSIGRAITEGEDPNQLCDAYDCTMLQLLIMIEADVWEQEQRFGAPNDELVLFLIDRGADPFGVDTSGQTALDYAVDTVYAHNGREYHKAAANRLRTIGVGHSSTFLENMAK